MLEREHLPGAAEARLHLVDAEERPVLPAERLRTLEVAGRRHVHSLALNRLDEEERNVLAPQLPLERIEVAKRNAVEVGKQRAETRDELGVAVRRERAERETVEAVVDGDDTSPLRRGAAELERGFDGFGAGTREEHALEARGRPSEQRFGKEPRQRRDAELHGAGRLELQRLDERGPDARVVAPDVVHPEPAEHVEVAVAAGVVEVRAVAHSPRCGRSRSCAGRGRIAG